MASIRSEIRINITPQEAWAAIKDVGAVHKRLVPGLLTDAHLDDDARIVTFSNGLVVRETFVAIKDQERRFVYTAAGLPLITMRHCKCLTTATTAAISYGSAISCRMM
jgi:hypothetical protein